jgi:hypothetical protein
MTLMSKYTTQGLVGPFFEGLNGLLALRGLFRGQTHFVGRLVGRDDGFGRSRGDLNLPGRPNRNILIWARCALSGGADESLRTIQSNREYIGTVGWTKSSSQRGAGTYPLQRFLLNDTNAMHHSSNHFYPNQVGSHQSCFGLSS